MISNALLNRDVLNVSSRYTGLENFSSEESLTCQLMSHVQDSTINQASFVQFQTEGCKTIVSMQLSFDSVTRKYFSFIDIHTHIRLHTHSELFLWKNRQFETIQNCPQYFCLQPTDKSSNNFFFCCCSLQVKTCDQAGYSAIPNPFLCFLVCSFCYPYQFDPISCLFPDNSCCTTAMQVQQGSLFFFFNEICYQCNVDTQIYIFMPNCGTDTSF